MKHFKQWSQRTKRIFVIRIISILVCLGGLVGVIVANVLGDRTMNGTTFIIFVAIFAMLVTVALMDVFKFVMKVNAYFSQVEDITESNKDPEYVKAARELRTSIEDLDIETLDTVKQAAAKEDISRVLAAKTIVMTEKTVELLDAFMAKYPGKNPAGVKSTIVLKELYEKRIQALSLYTQK